MDATQYNVEEDTEGQDGSGSGSGDGEAGLVEGLLDVTLRYSHIMMLQQNQNQRQQQQAQDSFFAEEENLEKSDMRQQFIELGCQMELPGLAYFSVNDWLQIQLQGDTRHSGFFPQFLFHFETSNVHFMSRKSDISQEPIDDLASKLINYLTTSLEKGSVLTLKGVNQ